MTPAISAALAAIVLAVPGAAVANERDDALSSLPASAWPASITRLDRSVSELRRNVSEVDRTTSEGSQTVISLASDVLFAFDKATISERARDKIDELVAEVPKGAEVQVHGHTDSIGSAAYNQELSEKRARAVAEVIESVRSDLRLQVKGFGKDRPVESNDEPAGRALNRRVEIRYSG